MSKHIAIAVVAVPLPVDRLFEYSIPERLTGKIVPGMRVRVIFNKRKMFGYVLSHFSRIPQRKLNPLIDIADRFPIVSPMHLRLAKKLRAYYIASYGEIIEAMLPAAIKGSKRIDADFSRKTSTALSRKHSFLYVQNSSDELLFDFYKNKITEKIQKKENVLFVVPEVKMIKMISERLETIKGIRIGTWHGNIGKKAMISLWHALAHDEINVLIGTRSSVFAPLLNVGIIVIYDENNSAHKENQAPYYHTTTVARMRSEIEGCEVIMSSAIPSSQMFLLIKNKKVDSVTLNDKTELAEIVFAGINFRDKINIMLERELAAAVEKKEKVFIFHNRKGFATLVFCKKCKKAIKCERCSSNLHYDFRNKQLFCSYCNYRTAMQEICPYCNASYVRFEGVGIEKIASNLKLLFPGANIAVAKSFPLFDKEIDKFDIVLTTSRIPPLPNFKPDVFVIWNADSLLNSGDYNAAENTYQLLVSFLRRTKKKLVICTGLHRDFYVYKALEKKDFNEFYENELKGRRDLQLPPFYHLGLISMRGFDKKFVEQASQELFDSFKNKTHKNLLISDPSDFLRSRLRGKYYRYALIKSRKISALTKTIRSLFNEKRNRRVTITANIDPV